MLGRQFAGTGDPTLILDFVRVCASLVPDLLSSKTEKYTEKYEA